MRCYPDPLPDKDAHNAQHVLARHAQNSKPVITALTIIAGEHRESNAATIVSALEQHIAEGNAYQRLPAMYVLDSIVKNIGEPYATLFGMNLHEVRDSTSLHRRAYVRGVFDAVHSLWRVSSPISNRTLETDTNCPGAPWSLSTQRLVALPLDVLEGFRPLRSEDAGALVEALQHMGQDISREHPVAGEGEPREDRLQN